MYFDNDAERMKFVRQATLIGNTVVASAYSALEIGALWLNDCAGQSQVISCAGGQRKLENITLDCGAYV